MTKTISRRTLGTIAAVCLAGSLAGCGIGETNPAAGTGDSGQITVLRAPVFFEPLMIAKRQGFFKEEGLNVKIVDGGTAAQQVAQLVSGKVNIAATGGVSTIAAVAKGMPIKAFMGNQNATPRPVTSGILVKKDSPIRDYGDLAGKTIGLQGLKETTNLGSLMALEDHGVDPGSVKFVQLPLPNLNDAVVKGQVDAAYNIGSFYPTGIQMGLRTIGSPGNTYLKGGPNAWYVSSDEFLSTRREDIKRFVAAMTKATEYAIKHPKMVQDLQIEFTDQDPEYVRSAPIQKLATKIDKAGTTTTIKGLNKYRFISADVSYGAVVWPDAPQK
ncbi:MAG: PhnD/SsuA/transferrin family substrate-binding protein [Pseudonocardiaceae bacterium]|nr:PhnD/SsuA/transferrin family substrate-binding protein [Pseudonocardiaceae bacterium]